MDWREYLHISVFQETSGMDWILFLFQAYAYILGMSYVRASSSLVMHDGLEVFTYACVHRRTDGKKWDGVPLCELNYFPLYIFYITRYVTYTLKLSIRHFIFEIG